MTDFISILQSAALEASELEAKRPPADSLKWKLNHKWLINPPVQCPWCHEWLPTGRVWVVDEAERKVRRVWKLDGERLNAEACHPHVGTAGAICMGNALTAVDALTASLSNDAYVEPRQWLPEELGHRCETMGEELESDAGEENTFICGGCGEEYDDDDSYRSEYTDELYCSDCYWEVHSSCHYCGYDYHDNQSELRTTPYGDYCPDCFHEKFFECEGCDEVFKLEERLGDDRCEDCYGEKWESCRECGEEFERSYNELDDKGLCESCRPKQEECLDCHFDYDAGDLIAGLCPDCQDKQAKDEENLVAESGEESND